MHASDWFLLARVALLTAVSVGFFFKARGELGCEAWAWHGGRPMHPYVALLASAGLAALAGTRMVFWLRQRRRRREADL